MGKGHLWITVESDPVTIFRPLEESNDIPLEKSMRFSGGHLDDYSRESVLSASLSVHVLPEQKQDLISELPLS